LDSLTFTAQLWLYIGYPSSAFSSANVRGHSSSPVARLQPKRSEAESAGGVTRVAIRWIALLAFCYFH
jgi:hypothetical protein